MLWCQVNQVAPLTSAAWQINTGYITRNRSDQIFFITGYHAWAAQGKQMARACHSVRPEMTCLDKSNNVCCSSLEAVRCQSLVVVQRHRYCWHALQHNPCSQYYSKHEVQSSLLTRQQSAHSQKSSMHQVNVA